MPEALSNSYKPYIPPVTGSGDQAVGNLVAGKKASMKDISKAANDFESVFLSQMLAPMWQGVGEDNYLGGGSAEETYRSLLINEYGKLMSKSGGLGIADAVKREIIKMQEKSA